MPRANRHFLPGHIWHITHRCHQKEFLLKFSQDRQRYIQWLYQGRKRFGVSVLNYTVTCNHVHLLVKNDCSENNIPALMQLVSGRVGQEYNQRKGRKGAFWEDRYHATAIESGPHLTRCLTYIDLNMVRAGVVKHPAEWPHGGYQEVYGTRRRNTVLDLDALLDALELSSVSQLREVYRDWIDEALLTEDGLREEHWTRSIAVGSSDFIRQTQAALGARGKPRDIFQCGEAFVLREAEENYGPDFVPKNRPIAPEKG
ncbi:transposase [Desulfuromonas versatilis]|uniref:transposase n=1 Tax=Desulfuromonas versatilis TaxID=2802975 RepID=UPI001CED446F|nr:transposase [Desulfuromonas versatilis]